MKNHQMLFLTSQMYFAAVFTVEGASVAALTIGWILPYLQ